MPHNVIADRNAFHAVQRRWRIVVTEDGTTALADHRGWLLGTEGPISATGLARATAMYRRRPATPRTRAMGYATAAGR